MESSWNWKNGGMSWDTTLVLKIWLRQILLINFHQKCHSRDYSYRHHCTNILQAFIVGLLRYLKLCFSWMAPSTNEIVEESYYTVNLCCFFIYEIKQLVTNNEKLWILIFCHIGCPKYQIAAIVFFYFQVSWGGRGVVWGWLALVNSMQENRQPPRSVVKLRLILCFSCVHSILVIL